MRHHPEVFDDDVWRYAPLGPVPTLAIGAVGVAILIALSLTHGPRVRRLARGLLVLTTLVVLAATLGGSSGSTGNLVPGRTIHDELVENVNHALGVMNVAGNVLLFVPVGWLVVIAVRRSVLVATLSAGALSLVIEVVQAFVGRAPDVDDLILNTGGGLVGGAVAWLVSIWGERGWQQAYRQRSPLPYPRGCDEPRRSGEPRRHAGDRCRLRR